MVANLSKWKMRVSCMNNKVSVIIPTYNRSERLTRAINSVLEQTYDDVEVLVVDDNNPDSPGRQFTEKMMEPYKDELRVKYLKHDYNKNAAAARNTGLRFSEGSMICFLDDDDYYLPNKVQAQVNYLKTHKQYMGVYCGRYQNGGEILPSQEGDLTKEILSLSFTPTTPSLMFNRNVFEVLKGFNETYRRHQDFEFLIRYFQHFQIGYVQDPLIVIGENEGENTIHGRKLDELKKQFFSDFDFVIKTLDRRTQKDIYCSHYSSVFWDHLKRKHYSLALRNFAANVAKYPVYYIYKVIRRLFTILNKRLKK